MRNHEPLLSKRPPTNPAEVSPRVLTYSGAPLYLWPVPVPVPVPSTPHPAPPVAPGKVVVVSTTHDPATPYQAGVDLARELGAPLITYDGTQHTAVFNGDRCVDGAVVRYFVDGTLPPASLHCQP